MEATLIAIVQAVASIARTLGFTTTAEGVETGLQRDYQVALGYNEAQGYLFSPAVPIDKVPEIIALPLTGGLPAYLDWVAAECAVAPTTSC